MTAIVTTQFRVVNAENFKEDIQDVSNSVYVAIGKADAWSNSISDLSDTIPFVPNDHGDDLAEAQQSLIGLKKIASTNVSHVVPRYNWTTGQTYVAWDSSDSDIYDKRFYVVTDEFKVYKCIVAGGGAVSEKPVHIGTDPQETVGDGYVWKFMYTITAEDSEKFLTNSFMPVKTLATSPVLAEEDVDYNQQQVQINSAASATHLGIERIVVTDGGSGYATAPTVNITGDGTGATATATVVAGVVTEISVTAKGTDYTVADITFSGGGGADAAARAVLAPSTGHGVDPVQELGGFYIGVNARLDGDEEGDFAIGQDFRQILLIKNPYDFGTTNVSTAATRRATRSMVLTSITTAPVEDNVLTGATSGAIAFVADYDAGTGTVYYYQNSKSGYGTFQAAENVNITAGVNAGTSNAASISSLGDPEHQTGSGQVIFLENRNPINRPATGNQIEDIKLIIEF